MSPFKLNKT